MQTSRHHPALVALHWISAVLILVALLSGILSLTPTPNTAPEKVNLLRAHMILGVVILVLTIARLAVRVFTSRPAPATTGNAWLDRVAFITTIGLYAAVILMVGSGFAIAVAAGLPGIVFGDSGAPLPESLTGLAARSAHGVFARVILGLVVLHLLGTLYHHIFLQDGLLRRMWFGRRTAGDSDLAGEEAAERTTVR